MTDVVKLELRESSELSDKVSVKLIASHRQHATGAALGSQVSSP